MWQRNKQKARPLVIRQGSGEGREYKKNYPKSEYLDLELKFCSLHVESVTNFFNCLLSLTLEFIDKKIFKKSYYILCTASSKTVRIAASSFIVNNIELGTREDKTDPSEAVLRTNSIVFR